MRLRTLAALAALPLALASCAETAKTAGNVGAAAHGPPVPPIENLCGFADNCLEFYRIFSSEAFGAGGLAEHWTRKERRARQHDSWRDKEAAESEAAFLRTLPKSSRDFVARARAEHPRQTSDWWATRARHRQERERDFVARWLAEHPSDREGYLALAAAALGYAMDAYCNYLPRRASDLGASAGQPVDWWSRGPDIDYVGRRIAAMIEGEGEWGLVAPGYENAGESLVSAMPCDGGPR